MKAEFDLLEITASTRPQARPGSLTDTSMTVESSSAQASPVAPGRPPGASTGAKEESGR